MGSLTIYVEFRVKQKIFYDPQPDPSLRSSPAQMSVSLPGNIAPTSAPSMSSWPQQKLPTVIVRGVIFDKVNVEVECKVGNTHLIALSVRLSLLF
jgi:hypothetical protein